MRKQFLAGLVVAFVGLVPIAALAQSPSPSPTAAPTPTPPVVGGPTQARPYINPDKGKVTENPNVAASSSCQTPVTSDTQPVGKLDGTGNVHVDGCLLLTSGAKSDGTASFELSGVGILNACPDPDTAGPKTATLSADKKRCTLTGFEADNSEFHTRLVSDTAGTSTVTFCADTEANGCADATVKGTVTVTWTPTGAVDSGIVPEDPTARMAIAALVAIAAGYFLLRRRPGAQTV